ncbi:23S rRNA (adenine(2503)-C(2))-methyltransferase RlmN [Tissierella praeacuta]|uniref:23S rRNA (adenine(2503)-C(2))-methyltransferase RlmN n=1 Tax=Tissierella praeacuta TaxID=43131 RepID=UPI003341776C
MNKIELNSLTLKELKEYMISIEEKAFRGEQAFSYFHRNKKADIEDLKILPENLRKYLLENAKVNKIDIYKVFTSKIDNTKKYLFLLDDMNIIESVAMEYNHGLTACISTQVGCKMGCSFCASTKEGLIRDLTPAEMANQIYMMEKDLGKDISNIVLMGSGEPLDNYDNTMKFIDIIHDEKGHNISLRNITLSTCGVVPRIYDLAKKDIPITLSISLHSPFDSERKRIMPIANRYSIEELIKACRSYSEKTKRRITFEYTLIDNINDRDADIKELIKILEGLKCHINLIPLNPIREFNKDRPSRKNIERVQKILSNANIAVTIRREMGGDISASCGQLRRAVTQGNDNKRF